MADMKSLTIDGTTYDLKDADARTNKLDKNQGTQNAGKFLVVNSQGMIEPVAMSAWQGGNY